MSQSTARQCCEGSNPSGAVVIDLGSRRQPRFGRDEACRVRAANDAIPGANLHAVAAPYGVATFQSQYPGQQHVQARSGDVEAEARDLTVLFGDIRGFTAISEALQHDPLRLAQLTAAVLETMAGCVVAHGGTIDKFIGDGVMAFWGAPLADPDHASRAVAAAEAMLAAVEALNEDLDLTLPDGSALPPIRIGVGVNSGRCAFGHVGSTWRRDPTVLGNPVNVAARLVELTKAYDLHLLVGEATAARLPASRGRREVDCVVPRGLTERLSLFALSPPETAADWRPHPGQTLLH